MRGFFIFFGCAIIAVLCNSAMATNKIDSCNLFVNKEEFFAIFPVINEKRHTWEWGMGPDSETISYSWIVELGFKEDNKFKKFDYALAVTSLLNFDKHLSEKEISLEHLISKFSIGRIYSSVDDAQERWDAHQSLKHMAILRLVYEDNIVVYSKQQYIREFLFSNRPTHALLTASLPPYPDESYTCMTEIIYD